MIRFSKIFLGFTLVVLLAWQIPWCYAFLTQTPGKSPFTIYSSLLGDFIITRTGPDKQVHHQDTQGRIYSQHQVDSLLPALYVRQLTADERFPDSICGKAVSPKAIRTTNFIFRSIPSDINTATTGLYFLLESASSRVDLRMPPDAFRFTRRGIEFIHMDTNQIDYAKSKAYTQALQAHGFRFPPHYVAGNPTPRKEYDAGYLIVDAEHQLFHLKCVAGRPYVAAIRLPQQVVPEYAFVTEFSSRATLGFVVDAQHKFYVIHTGGRISPTGLPAFDPVKEELTIIGNMFHWTVKRSTATADYYYALTAADYSLVQTYAYPGVRRSIPGLSFTSPDDRFVFPRL